MSELVEWLAMITAALVLAWGAFNLARTPPGGVVTAALGAVFAFMAAVLLFALAFNAPALDQPAILDGCRESGGVQMAYVGGEWACITAEQAG